MQENLRILLISVVLFSCAETKTTNRVKSLDFSGFRIEAPSEWEKVKAKGIDSYVGRIAIDKGDTLEFDLGYYSHDLTEYYEIKMADGKTYYINSNDTAYSPKLVDSANKDKVVKSTVSWEIIDGRKSKILSPIKPGIGTTGIYIDSLWQDGNGTVKFNLYGTNLKSKNENAVLTAFKSLKFKKPK